MSRLHPIGRVLKGTVLLSFALLLAACGEPPPPPASRTIVLGFDGMDPDLTAHLIEQGELPNLERLAKTGYAAPLATSNPPQSPVAWSSFATGTGPGDHGIFDFLRRVPETYAPDFSISEVVEPENSFEIFGMTIPLGSAEIINRRQGTPFWMTAEENGNPTTILRVPVTFPPDDVHRMLAGMGVPDLLGTQGTYSYYTTRRSRGDETGGRVVYVRARRDGIARTEFEGPPHPLSSDGEPLSVPMEIEPWGNGVRVTLDDEIVELKPRRWSDWVKVGFDFGGIMTVNGMVRLYLIEAMPDLRLYVSPINFDPTAPEVPLSTPDGFASDLAGRIGLYHTIGMPEETWSLNGGRISDKAYLQMVETILGEREAMHYDALERNDSALVVTVFVQTDRISHMFWRGIDPKHPRYEDTDELGRGAIRWIYHEADRIVGETLKRMGPNDRLVILSDHGFAPFRHAVHLNRWLVDNGFMTLKPGRTTSPALFANVDWSKTTAYALGLNGLYINMEGREAQGIVKPGEAQAIKAQVAYGLMQATHPETGDPIFDEIYDGADIYQGENNADAPDLVTGFHRGFRASWQTTLGAVPQAFVEPNDQKWSGDHCIAPTLVPGVFFTSWPVEDPPASIREVGAFLLSTLEN